MFLSSSPGVNGYGSVCHEPCSKTNISSFFFADEEKGATSVLGPQPIIWLLPSSSPWSGDFVRATRCHPSQVTVNSNSSHPTSTVSVGYHVTIYIYIYFFLEGSFSYTGTMKTMIWHTFHVYNQLFEYINTLHAHL